MIVIFALALFLLRFLYSLAEIYFERDWPRSTWRGLVTSAILTVFCITVFS